VRSQESEGQRLIELTDAGRAVLEGRAEDAPPPWEQMAGGSTSRRSSSARSFARSARGDAGDAGGQRCTGRRGAQDPHRLAPLALPNPRRERNGLSRSRGRAFLGSAALELSSSIPCAVQTDQIQSAGLRSAWRSSVVGVMRSAVSPYEAATISTARTKRLTLPALSFPFGNSATKATAPGWCDAPRGCRSGYGLVAA